MTDKDRRVFMYRGQEAKLFDSPDDVPANEGWLDHPTETSPAPVSPVETPVEPASDQEPEQSDMELDALRARASELGIKVDARWRVAKLQRMIAEAESTD